MRLLCYSSSVSIILILVNPCSTLAAYNRTFYPDYCSDPSAMKRRKIPPLPDKFIPLSSQTYATSTAATDAGVSSNNDSANATIFFQTQILQSFVIFRHGARTPYTPLSCWNNYIEDWDCSLTTLMAPKFVPKTNDSTFDNVNNGPSPMFLFDKYYTALKSPQSNYLNGTCSLGQLIEQGHDQMRMNGKYIREAYITNENQPHLKLFDSTYYSKRPYDEAIYLRSDDGQRTLTSCQVLFQGIFDLDDSSNNSGEQQEDVIIPIHLADLEQDVLDFNERVCPNLKRLQETAKDSAPYKNRIQSKDVQQLYHTMTETIGASSDMIENGNFIDCLMTSYCTDRMMPDILLKDIDDSSSLFNQFLELFTWQYYYPAQWLDGLYAKISMGALWYEILKPLKETSQCMSRADMQSRKLPRLLLFSGHDDTLTPLLISLGVWDQKWTPYASMLIIEVHVVIASSSQPPGDVNAIKTFPSDHAFRLLYNGNVLTTKINGCEEDLCDLNILLNLIEPFTTNLEQKCRGESSTLLTTISQKLDTSVTVPVAIFVAVIFALIGSASTALVLHQTKKRDANIRKEAIRYEESLELHLDTHMDGFASVSRSPFTIDEENEEENNE